MRSNVLHATQDRVMYFCSAVGQRPVFPVMARNLLYFKVLKVVWISSNDRIAISFGEPGVATQAASLEALQ